jgi:hypothetical protein
LWRLRAVDANDAWGLHENLKEKIAMTKYMLFGVLGISFLLSTPTQAAARFSDQADSASQVKLAQTAPSPRGDRPEQRGAQPQSNQTTLTSLNQSDKEKISGILIKSLGKWPGPYAPEWPPETRRFMDGLKPLVVNLQDTKKSDAQYTADAQKLSTYISENSKILNNAKLWRNAALAKQLANEFGDGAERKIKHPRDWCWKCLGEFIDSVLA